MSGRKFIAAAVVLAVGLASSSAAYALNSQPEPPNHNISKIAVVFPPSPVLGR